MPCAWNNVPVFLQRLHISVQIKSDDTEVWVGVGEIDYNLI